MRDGVKMSLFESINSDELATTATLIAVASSKVLNVEELNVLGNFIIAVGSIMTSIASQEQALKVQKDTTKSETQEKGDDVQKQIKDIQEQIQYLLQKQQE